MPPDLPSRLGTCATIILLPPFSPPPPNPQVKILYETLEAEDDLSEYVSTERVKYEIHYIHLMYY